MQAEQFELNYAVETSHWWFTARRSIFGELIRQILPPSRETTIVDVGCGTGGNFLKLAQDYNCVGIDPSAAAIELAKRRQPQVQFIRGFAPDDLGDLCQQAQLFMLTDVLEHVPDDFALLSRLFSVAKPGAYFLLTVPADERLWSAHDESHRHYRRYDRARFQRLWRDLPATELLAEYYNARLYPVVRGMRALNRLRGRSSGAADTDLKMPSPQINQMLHRTFASESRVLRGVLAGAKQQGYARGVSLIAILRREPGEVQVQGRPDDVATDVHTPSPQPFDE